MNKKRLLLFLTITFLLTIQCSIFEPKNEKGSISILLVSKTDNSKLLKTQETLYNVHCTLKKGSSTIHDEDYSKSGGSFNIKIDELEPADNYSVLLYGKDYIGNIIGRAFQSSISVTAGDEASVSMSWTDVRPDLISPPDGSTITDDSLTFDWSDVSDAVAYELEVDNSSSFTSPEIDQSSLTSSTYTPSSSLSDDTYYWRVRAKDSYGTWGDWSSTWSFTIDTQGPEPPTLVSPTNGSSTGDNTPTFDWLDVSSAITYELEVDNSSSFTSPEIDQPSLTSSGYIATSSLSDGKYYWRVRAKDSQGNWGGWSSMWNFTIDTQGPELPTLVSPTNGSFTGDNTPTFDWSDVSGVSSYELQVYNTNSFSSPNIDQNNLTSSNYTAVSSLSDSTWYWRVRAKDSQGNWGGWSNTWSFTINTQVLSAPILSSPSNGSTINDNTPLFDWSDVSGVSSYELQVDHTNSFSSPNIDQNNLTSSNYTAVSSLSDSTWYWHVRAKDSYGTWGDWSSTWSFNVKKLETGTMTGNDGKTYTTVKIGNQWWMAENLKETQYRNGDAIPGVKDDATWAGLSAGAHCAYNNNESTANTYGYLYNWYAVDDSRNIAPSGWHVPTDEEWKELERHLGMSQSDIDNTGWRGTDEGGKLKITSGWYAEGNGTNESGFSALPGGCRYRDDGHFSNMNYSAYFWSSGESNSTYAWYRGLDYKYSGVYRNTVYKQFGFAIRLVKGEASTPVLTNITISPLEVTLKNGETQQFICTATYLDQSTKNVTASTSWSISPGTTGSIDANGLFTVNANSAGRDTIRAAYQGQVAKGYVTVSNVETSTMTDQDGNTYQTVKIGNQWWMAENLKVTHFRNGNAIPNVIDSLQWSNMTTSAYCNYNNDTSYVKTYGRLYNWYAVDDSRNIAPSGWHVPTDEEWTTLTTYLGGESVAGGKMKEDSTAHWKSPNTGATNVSGFSALPGGYRYDQYDSGYFGHLGYLAFFWSSTQSHSYDTWFRLLYYDNSEVGRSDYRKRFGFSVRLIRD